MKKYGKAFRLTIGMIMGIIALLAAASERDKYSLTAPNGLSFGVIQGYQSWQLVASHYRTDKSELRFIFGNKQAIDAYLSGAGKQTKPFPDGSLIVKTGYSIDSNPDFPSSIEPAQLQRVEVMVKDSKKFQATGGWGYARFLYDANSATFSPYGKDSTVATECYSCHLIVAKKDYVFTDYVPR